MGPLSQQQQLCPEPHFYNTMYPPHRAPASELQYSFDPLGSSQPATLPARLPSSAVLGLAVVFARLLNTPAGPTTLVAPPPSLDLSVGPRLPRRCLSPNIITNRRRRVRSAAAPQRSSSRIAAKASSNFVDMTTQVVQRKALLNSRPGCSKTLKKHVNKRNILLRNLLPIGGADLRKLVTAAKLGCKNSDVSGVVTEVVE